MGDETAVDDQACPECGAARRLFGTDDTTQIVEAPGNLEVSAPTAWGCTNPECAAYEPRAEALEGADEDEPMQAPSPSTPGAASANEPTGGDDIGA